MCNFVQIYTMAPSRDIAESIANSLLEQKLAACVQISSSPVTSFYRWDGRIERGEEWRCSIKTMRDRFSQVAEAIRDLHPYEVPEIISHPLDEGDPAYLAWIEESLQG